MAIWRVALDKDVLGTIELIHNLVKTSEDTELKDQQKQLKKCSGAKGTQR